MPNSTNNEKGLAPIAIIIAVVVVAAVGGFFLLNKGGGGGVSLPVVGVPLNPNCKFNDPDLCKFMNNFKAINNYSAKSTTTDKSGKKMDSTFESIGSDKTHIVYSDNGKETYNVITISDTTYTKDYTDSKWWKQKQPKQEKQVETQSNPTDVISKGETEDKTTYKKISTEACGSMQCFKYQIIDPTNTDTTEYIWFDNSQYMLRRERSEGKDGTVTETQISYSGVNITAPSPTKDAKPDQIILPTGGVPETSGQDLQNMQKQQPQTPQATEVPAVPDNSTPTDTSGGD